MKLSIDVIANMRGNFEKFKQDFSMLKTNAFTANSSINELQKNMNNMLNIRNGSTSLEQIRKLNVEISKTKKEIGKLENMPPKTFINRLEETTEKYKGLIGAMAGAAVVGMGKKSVNLALDAEQARTAYGVLLKDKQKAVNLLGDMDVFAAKTPFSKTDLVESGQSLLGFGVQSEKLLPIMGKLGDLSMGNANKFKSLVDNYGKLVSAQRGNTMDLNQFAIAGIPIWTELSKILKMSTQDVRKYVETNGVSVELVNQAIGNLTQQGGQFFNMMNEQSATGAGQWSNLLDALEQLGTKVGNLLMPAFKAFTSAMSWAVDKANGLVGFLEKNREVMVLLSIAATPVIAKYTMMSSVFAYNALQAKFAKIAQMGLLNATQKTNMAMLANPYVLAAAGVAALTYGIYKLIKAKREANGVHLDENKIRGQAIADTAVEQAKVQSLMGIIRSNNYTRKEQINALNQLKEIAPQYFGNLDIEKAKTDLGTKAVAAYTAELVKNAMQKIANELRENDGISNTLKDRMKSSAEGSYGAIQNDAYSYLMSDFVKRELQHGVATFTDNMGQSRSFNVGDAGYGGVYSYIEKDKELQKSLSLAYNQSLYGNRQTELSNQFNKMGLTSNFSSEQNGGNNTTGVGGGNIIPDDAKNNILGGGQKSITITINKVIETQNLVAQQAKEIPSKVGEEVYPAILQILYKAGLVAG